MKVLFVYQKSMPFIEQDMEILQKSHSVRESQVMRMQDLSIRLLTDLVALWRGIQWCDITFSWFGKFHAFCAVLFSKILGKKAVVVAGGDDVAYEPEIGYGMFSYWWKKWCPLFVFKYADLIIPVSEINKEETIKNAKADPRKVKMIYHGFSRDKIRRIPKIPKEDIVITIGRVSQETKVKKGLELFVKSATFLPHIKFFLIGPDVDGALKELRNISPSNLEITGGIYGKKLVEICNRAKVYVQVSIHESFGCSLAEAMLCECVPVVSQRAALPEVVDDCGFYVEDLSPKSVAEKIKEALSTSDDLGKKSRERIKTHFSLSQRQHQLLEAIKAINNE